MLCVETRCFQTKKELPVIRCVFWDWDGTLCDSHTAWLEAQAANFRHFGAEPPSENEYFAVLGTCGGDYVAAYERFGIIKTQSALVFRACFRLFEDELDPYIQNGMWNIRNKSKAITNLARFEGMPVKHCAYVGDTVSDMKRAQEAGALAIAFLNPYNDHTALKAACPDYTITDLREILDIVSKAP